jgi:hypothetical protein
MNFENDITKHNFRAVTMEAITTTDPVVALAAALGASSIGATLPMSVHSARRFLFLCNLKLF